MHSFPHDYFTRYVSTEDANIKERWLWTSVPIYLIQPPSVFQFISLLFSHHHISNRIRELTVHLPPACYNISAPSCHDSSTSVSYLNNKYLDVLTNEVSLVCMILSIIAKDLKLHKHIHACMDIAIHVTWSIIITI